MIFKKKRETDPDFDPQAPSRASKWFSSVWFSPVDLAGEFLDFFNYWHRSRRWSLILAVLPALLVAATLGVLVAVGELANGNKKLIWYADLANETMKESDAKADEKTESGTTKDAESIEAEKAKAEYVDLLFRRVLQLNQNNKFALFYVAEQLTRYGNRGAARQIMESLAPNQNDGHAQAHAWMAMDMVDRLQKGETINMESLKHHLKRGVTADRVAPGLLALYSQFLQQEGRTSESQEMLRRAAKSEPKLLLNSIKSYIQSGLTAQANSTADALVDKVKDKWTGEKAEENLLLAAEAFVLTNRVDNAIDVLQTGMRQNPASTVLRRATSDAYRFKFRSTAVASRGQVQVKLDFLDAAIAIDPSNTSIQEELGILSQIGIGQSEANRENLRAQIATSGTSYVARLLLAESAYRRGETTNAISHYEIVLAELPSMSLVRNNLAMLFATATPTRLTEAMGQIDKAIEISPGYPEFLDSRGDILALLEREPEAVESYLAALEKAPFRIQTHQKAIVLMEELGQLEQAEAQRGKLAEAQKAIERQQEEMKAAAEQQKKSQQPISESGTGLVPGSAAAKPDATETAQETANSVEPEQPGVKEKQD